MSLLDTLINRPLTTQKLPKCVHFDIIPLTTNTKINKYKSPGTIVEKICQWSVLVDELYCKNHLYLKKFSSEQRPFLRYCTKCRHYFLPDFEETFVKKTCSKCVPVYQASNAKIHQARCQIAKCVWFNPITNMKCGNTQQNQEYCSDHVFFAGINLNKVCRNFIKNCVQEKVIDREYCIQCLEYEDKIPIISENQLKLENNQTIEQLTFICHHANCNFRGKLSYFVNDNNEISKICKWCRLSNSEVSLTTMLEKSNFRDLINQIRINAKRNRINMNLTNQEIILFLTSPCYYCSELDELDFNFPVLINQDCSIGYINKNCVACCGKCHQMKNGLFKTIESFLQACINIKNNIGREEQYRANECQLIYSDFNSFQHDMKEQCLGVEMSEAEYFATVSKKCYYCNCTNSTVLTVNRKNSQLQYVVDNCFSCCTICHQMGNSLDFELFKIQIEKIVLQQKSSQYFGTIKKLPTVITKEWLKDKLLDLSNFLKTSQTIAKYHDIYVDNRKSKFQPQYNDKHYKDLVYQHISLDYFEPEIEFVESSEQNDRWMYFRLKMSSLKNSKLFGCLIKMLIRDKKTKLYVGFASLTSDVKYLLARDKYIGWTLHNKFVEGKLNSILNISTCVGLRPFCYNFNGGKLIAKLMFSQEVFNYVSKMYPDWQIVGLLTTSINGKSIQYDRLPELKFIGYTKGFGTIHIPDIFLTAIELYIKQSNIPISLSCKKNKLFRLTQLSKHLGLGDIVVNHGINRGVYFGYLCQNAQKFLCGDDQVNLIYDLKSTTQIYQEWKQRWAEMRFLHLLNENRLLYDVEFNSNCILRDSDLTKNRVNRYRSKQNNNSSKVNLKQYLNRIIQYVQFEPNISHVEISRRLLTENIQITQQHIGKFRKKYNINFRNNHPL